MKKTLSIVAGLMLTIFFFAGSQQASAQKYDEILSPSTCGLRLVEKYAIHSENETYAQSLKNTPKFGYINDNGKVVIPLIYDDAEPFTESGIAVVKKGKRYGVINTKGATVVPIQYNTVWVTERNGSELGYIILINDKDQRAYATIKGKIILNFNSFDEVKGSCERRIKGNTYDCDYMVATKERKGVLSFAIYTFDGKTVIPYITSPKKDGYYHFLIEKDANYVIGMGGSRLNDGDECDIFEMGTGKVLYRNATFNKGFLHNNGKYYLLDNKGKCINGFEFDSVSSKEFVGGYVAAYSNGEKKIIDTETHTVCEQFDSIFPEKYSNDYAVVFSKGEKKVLDLTTKTISEKYDDLQPYGILHDKQLNKWIIQYPRDYSEKIIDTLLVDNYDIIGTSKTKFINIPGGKKTFKFILSNGITRPFLNDFQIKKIHQEFIYNHVEEGKPMVDTLYVLDDVDDGYQYIIYSNVGNITTLKGHYEIVEYRNNTDDFVLLNRDKDNKAEYYSGRIPFYENTLKYIGYMYTPANGSQQTGQHRRQSGSQQGTPQRNQQGTQQGTPQRNQQGTQQGTQPRRRHR